MKYFLTIAVVLFACVHSALAFDVMDRRGELLGWEAVGRVDNGRGYCTGTLIARDVVLTAGHCVHRRSGRPIPASELHFKAGYHHGKAIAVRKVTKWVVAPGYKHGKDGRVTTDLMSHDVALLKLDYKIVSSEADPFKIQDEVPLGTTVSVVSYGKGRDEVLSREAKCNIVQVYVGGVLGMDCNTTSGSSGAPVFVRDGGRSRILAVVSAGGKGRNGQKIAFAAPASELVTTLMAKLRNDASRLKPGKGAKRITIGQRDAGGARFVKP